MADAHHWDHQLTAQPFKFTLEGRAWGWGVAEQIDGLNHPHPVSFRQRGQRLRRRTAVPQRLFLREASGSLAVT